MLAGPTASTGHVSGQVRGVHHSSLFVPRTELPTEQVLRRRLLSAVSSRAADAWKDVDAWTMAPVIPTGENRHQESGHSEALGNFQAPLSQQWETEPAPPSESAVLG